MSDRLNELLRQRTIIQEHLTWLDRQIIAESDGISPLAPTPSALNDLEKGGVPFMPPPPPTLTSTPTVEATKTEQAAEAILADYKKDPLRQQSDIKRGCLLYFISALAFVSLVTILFYFLYSRRHAQEREHQSVRSPSGLNSH
jgi:hypothetical protein